MGLKLIDFVLLLKPLSPRETLHQGAHARHPLEVRVDELVNLVLGPVAELLLLELLLLELHHLEPVVFELLLHLRIRILSAHWRSRLVLDNSLHLHLHQGDWRLRGLFIGQPGTAALDHGVPHVSLLLPAAAGEGGHLSEYFGIPLVAADSSRVAGGVEGDIDVGEPAERFARDWLGVTSTLSLAKHRCSLTKALKVHAKLDGQRAQQRAMQRGDEGAGVHGGPQGLSAA
mmetsp:Transcript_64157/g.199063  ORF Transcript_64157/g.199063 Transcript_64157/m.199063 type:complete len:230 (-) Transcript_64157:3-692(-)